MFLVMFIVRYRYNNYHLFSFVPVQERLSGRALGTAYLGAVGMWIPVGASALRARKWLFESLKLLLTPASDSQSTVFGTLDPQ